MEGMALYTERERALYGGAAAWWYNHDRMSRSAWLFREIRPYKAPYCSEKSDLFYVFISRYMDITYGLSRGKGVEEND